MVAYWYVICFLRRRSAVGIPVHATFYVTLIYGGCESLQQHPTFFLFLVLYSQLLDPGRGEGRLLVQPEDVLLNGSPVGPHDEKLNQDEKKFVVSCC